MLKKVLSCILLISISCGITLTSYATTIVDGDQILDSELLNAYTESGNASEKQSVMIWISDIDSASCTIDLTEESGVLLSESDGLSVSATNVLMSNVSLDEYRNFLRNSASELDKDVANRLLSEYRSLCADAYATHNAAFVDSYLTDCEITYVSHYSPVIFAELSQSEAYSIASCSGVQKINLDTFSDMWLETEVNDNTLMPLSTSSSLSPAAAFEYAEAYNEKYLDMTHVNGGYSGLGLTGDGIVVGTVDNYGVAYEYQSVLGLDSDHNDWESGHTDGVFIHSTNVASIIRQFAPGCELYCAGANMHGGANGAVEWLIDQGVNILSLSFSSLQLSTCAYNTNAQWLDGVCNTTLVTAVSAVGNNGYFSDWGMGYNVIAVGNVQLNGSLCSSSSYNSMSVSGVSYKPDISAPGTDIMGVTSQSPLTGTSYATPVVAGICALMMECSSVLTYCPDLVKSVVTAAVNPSYTDDEGNVYTFSRNLPDTSDANYEKYGAGIIDCEKALSALRNGYFEYDVVPANQKPSDEYSIGMLSGKTYRISLSFLRPATGSIYSGNLAICSLPDLDLKLYDPNGNLVAYSVTAKNNIEILEYTPTVSGVYTIEVETFTASSGDVCYSVAWMLYT
ncbi:MAG: S8 family serine peptidase [Eubacteriales bacterium]